MKEMLFTLLFIGCLISCEVNPDSQNSVESLPPVKEETVYSLEASAVINLPEHAKKQHYRGLEIANNIAYISGTGGSVLMYDFNVKTWQSVVDSSLAHYRDLEVLDQKILLMGILAPATIKQVDLTLEMQSLSELMNSEDTTTFLDGMDFWKNGRGLLFGDPIDNFPLVFTTDDNGQHWIQVQQGNLPKMIANEAGFAASGTSIQCVEDGVGFIGLGGIRSRVFKTLDYGASWNAQETPLPKNQSGSGIYSLAFKNASEGVAVGGNWEYADCDSSKIYTVNGGETWILSEGIQGYRSCVTHLTDDIYISTGTAATDITYDGGRHWSLLDSIGFNAIQFMPNGEGIGISNNGEIHLLQLTKK